MASVQLHGKGKTMKPIPVYFMRRSPRVKQTPTSVSEMRKSLGGARDRLETGEQTYDSGFHRKTFTTYGEVLDVLDHFDRFDF